MPRRPRNRGIQRKHETIGLSEDQLDHLILGSTWFFKGGPEFPFESEEHRKECWHRHKKDIFAMMIDDDPGGFHSRLIVGQRPKAFFEYEDVPPRKITVTKIHPGNRKHPGGLMLENREIQQTPDYLDEHGLWLTDEKRRYLAMVERREVRENKLRRITDLDERREMLGEVRKAKEEYED